MKKKLLTLFSLLSIFSLGLTACAINGGSRDKDNPADPSGDDPSGDDPSGETGDREQDLINRLSKVNNYTMVSEIAYASSTSISHSKTVVTSYVTKDVIRQDNRQILLIDGSYQEFMTTFNFQTIEEMKQMIALEIEQSKQQGIEVTVTYDEKNQMVHIEQNDSKSLSSYYFAYDKVDKQYFFLDVENEKVDHFQYILDSDAQGIEKGFFVLNAQPLTKLITKENYNEQTKAYHSDDTFALYYTSGNNLAMVNVSDVSLVVEGDYIKEFSFLTENYYGSTMTNKTYFSSFNETATPIIPEFEKPICLHQYSGVQYESFGEEGHKDYCSSCKKYLNSEIEHHHYDDKYHICVDCLEIKNKTHYMNEYLIRDNGVPYVEMFMNDNNKVFVTGDFSRSADIFGTIYEGSKIVTRYVYDIAETRLAVVTLNEEEDIGNNCLKIQQHDIGVYEFDIEGHFDEIYEIIGDVAKRYEYVYDPTTDEYITVEAGINFDNIIRMLIESEDFYEEMEEYITLLCVEPIYFPYFSHISVGKEINIDECHTCFYNECFKCHEVVGQHSIYEHHSNWTDFALTNYDTYTIYVDADCGVCHEEHHFQINRMNDLNQYHMTEAIELREVIQSSHGGMSRSYMINVPHLFDESGVCLLCGEHR